ncbi:Formyltransferase/hydrolase complex subunit D [Botrimarina colliarenosi]|uniref:Formyltransferase/hydrolase complex subunit D n=2 Tax=Botrimarina colliarenosi TaxID=2528001 RepID=A0A5C6A6V9_9BACT|nr:Formyltransferase/hydrolase complex subunit D [Botrimarina colliarenosi]
MANGAAVVVDANAEAFAARYARLLITAADEHWLAAAVTSLCGYGASVIGCDCEIAVERSLAADETPDGRPGAAVLAFGFRAEALGKAVANRAGQTLLTCPTAAVFDGLPEAKDRAPFGNYLRYFGDGYERRDGNTWTLPVMEGEVSFPATVGVGHGVAGGVLLLCGRDQAEALAAARRAADAVRDLPGVITPFPGGVCRSGSKVGSRYKRLVASTNEAYCPTLKDEVETQLPAGTGCVYEIVVDGVDEAAVRAAMRAALQAAMAGDLLAITAPSYGGKLGKVAIALSELL